jgi:ATP-dependent helicase/DNAse subunit B
MAASIEVLTGIAGSGKTTRLLELYRRALSQAQNEARPGTNLWLTPSSHSRSAVLERLCDGQLPVVFAPNVLTFKDFAERILRGAPQQISPLSPEMQRHLLRRIVGRQLSRKALPHFSSIAETAGFLDLVTAFITELKRSETWPEAFTEACRQRGLRPADRELAGIYREYQAMLLDGGVYDCEGRFWSAGEALKAGHWGPFAELSLVVVDGFTDFTHTQHNILNLLADRVGRLAVSLPLESPMRRGDLFAKSQMVLDRLQASGPVSITSIELPGTSNDWLRPAFRHVSQMLFANPRETARAGAAEGIEVVAAAGQQGEVNWLAARVKQLLLAGARPGEIVVAVRDLADYRDLLVDRFAAANIPFVCGSETSLDELPICRALVQVLQLELEDWPFRRLMAVLDSSYFQPKWRSAAADDGASVRDVAKVLRRMKLSEGRARILDRLEKASREEAGSPAEQEEGRLDRAVIRRALALLRQLSEATEGLRRSHDLTGWAGTIGGLLSELGFDSETASLAAPETTTPLSPRVFRDRLQAALHDAAKAESLFDEAPESRTLACFLPDLTDLLRQSQARIGASAAGRVRILPAEDVRNLDVPDLLLAGLTERSFPRMQSDDCLYSEAERRELNRQGLSLAHRDQRAREEMLMFYNIVTRARRRLVLTYPVVTADGQPLSPSPYLTALLDLFDPNALRPQLEEELDPIPKPERVLSAADARIRGMFELLDKRPALLRSIGERPAFQATTLNLLAAVDAHVARFETPGFTNYEGMLENPDNLEWIRARFSAEREFSATQLEAFADCPFEFFVSHVLGVEPLASVEVETDYGRRGTLVHSILAELHRQLFDAEGDPAAPRSPADGTAITERFHQLLRERLGERPEHSALQQALLQIEERLLSDWGAAYGEQWQSYVAGQPEGADRPPLPSRFETAFGRTGTGRSEAGTLEPLIVGAGDHAVRIGGRIDRIDVGVTAGRTVFTVVDYKTGRARSDKLEDIASGRALQLALYTLAVLRLDIVGSGAGPLQMGYWHIREQGFSPGIRQRKKADGRVPPLEEATWESLVKTLDEVIPRLATAMRSGQFPVFNEDRFCTGRCPFHTVCRVAQIRALPPRLGKIWSK